MKISRISPTRIYNEGIREAVFSITIDDCITITDIKVIQKDKTFRA
ncbi:MAG: septation protein SpoVG family protein [Oscillospiraceae bacterium]|nr:septation protein SpoVG family protein [Oscillospiraceae bacterium]